MGRPALANMTRCENSIDYDSIHEWSYFPDQLAASTMGTLGESYTVVNTEGVVASRQTSRPLMCRPIVGGHNGFLLVHSDAILEYDSSGECVGTAGVATDLSSVVGGLLVCDRILVLVCHDSHGVASVCSLDRSTGEVLSRVEVGSGRARIWPPGKSSFRALPASFYVFSDRVGGRSRVCRIHVDVSGHVSFDCVAKDRSYLRIDERGKALTISDDGALYEEDVEVDVCGVQCPRVVNIDGREVSTEGARFRGVISGSCGGYVLMSGVDVLIWSPEDGGCHFLEMSDGKRLEHLLYDVVWLGEDRLFVITEESLFVGTVRCATS